ncbi:single-stranded nucleic acid binding R3H domain-containing protein [Spirochaeta thermophila DSM 6578]|uniref:RNA-binding protein KhpB n=1 Tax=Winmispira thermophila (strain ATCC 700085 / DSM 6578 / Z-1203) TaxID=869211 RepID=G0GAZ4_WINT7|nr:RNA-binding cell elongation regulator Jag/EloR [Spirochaeta thermophila]AEJ60296.1 single-stranded nucleic acid binding R3H domain-containing protein [Spirochaeta thermophila DSM 6578]
MVQEFEGRTEQEALQRAIESLGLVREEFDVEIVEEQKPRLFRPGRVVIRVHVPDGSDAKLKGGRGGAPQAGLERHLVAFLEGITERMGFPSRVKVKERSEEKLVLVLESEYSHILIGKKGKNLDALQVLANVIASRDGGSSVRVVLDAENYRERRQEQLVQLAKRVGYKVKRTKRSVLLEPMNPFERRLIHTTISGIPGVATKSEGEGLIKQVRVYYTDQKR